MRSECFSASCGLTFPQHHKQPSWELKNGFTTKFGKEEEERTSLRCFSGKCDNLISVFSCLENISNGKSKDEIEMMNSQKKCEFLYSP